MSTVPSLTELVRQDAAAAEEEQEEHDNDDAANGAEGEDRKSVV